MNSNSVIILGSGHLASRVKKLLDQKGCDVIQGAVQLAGECSTIEALEKALQGVDLYSVKACLVLYEEDKDNLEIVVGMMGLHSHLQVYTSFFNENIIPHLEAANPNLHVLNPARIAAPMFLEELNFDISKDPVKNSGLLVSTVSTRRDTLLKILIISFIALILSATVYFHFLEGWAWLDALYFVIVTVSTVGYGDINLQAAGPLSKLVGILLIIGSAVFIWLIFSLMIDRIIKNRVQRLLGRKRYKYKNHIILCGLGRLGYFVAEELVRRGEQLVIVELDEGSSNSDYFRSLKVDVYNGNARLPKVLQDVGVQNCKALISVISDDYINLEIALNARYFQPDIQLVLRIFDESMARVIKERFHIHQTQSMSYLAAQKFASVIDK